jgi:polygalacturonase
MNLRFSRRRLLQGMAALPAGMLSLRPLWAQESVDVGAAWDAPWNDVPEIRARIKPPQFPDRQFLVTDFGAAGDNHKVNTRAFAAAIRACNEAGGGQVRVPPGVYKTGPIRLLSHVDFHVAEGAELRFSQEPGDYLPLVQTWFEGVELMNYSPFIYAFEARNVAVTGQGLLNGQADFDVWWSWRGPREWKGQKSGTSTGWQEGMPFQQASRDVLFDMAARGVPVEERRFGEGHYLRSAMLEFNRCRNVLVEGVTIRNAAFWSVHPVLCRNVTAREVTIDNPVGANADGIDPECCEDVLIEDCRFDTGDDCISLKSGRDHDGRRIATPCRNVIITGCHFSSERSAISCGSESSGGINHIFVENVTASSIFRFFRIKTNDQRGGINENIHIRGASIDEALENLIEIQANFSEPVKDGPADATAERFYPVIRNISLSGIRAAKAQRAFNFEGSKDTPIEGLTLQDFQVGQAAQPPVLQHLVHPLADQVTINARNFSF